MSESSARTFPPDLEPDFDSPAARREMRRRHAELGIRLQRLAAQAIKELEQRVATGKPLTVEEAKTLLDLGQRLERSGGNEPEADDDAPIPSKKPN